MSANFAAQETWRLVAGAPLLLVAVAESGVVYLLAVDCLVSVHETPPVPPFAGPENADKLADERLVHVSPDDGRRTLAPLSLIDDTLLLLLQSSRCRCRSSRSTSQSSIGGGGSNSSFRLVEVDPQNRLEGQSTPPAGCDRPFARARSLAYEVDAALIHARLSSGFSTRASAAAAPSSSS